MALVAARRHLLGEPRRIVGVEAVGGDRRGVDESCGAGVHRGLEHSA
jgi:hypothetical protein